MTIGSVSRNWLIVLNPKPNRQKQRWLQLLLRTLSQRQWSYRIYQTSPLLSENQFYFQQHQHEFTDVIVLGGDGTLHMAANCLAHSPLPMSFLPCGTGNDFARAWYQGCDRQAILQIALDGEPQAIDLGKINDRFFINVAGIGFDGAVVAHSKDQKSWLPQISYLWQAIKQLFGYHAAAITLEGGPDKLHYACQTPSFLLAFGNNRYFGAGMEICPHAKLNDGHLAYCHLQDCAAPQKISTLAKVFSGQHVNSQLATVGQLHSVTVTSIGLPMEADGEWLGYSPASIECIANALILRAAPRSSQ